jgi:hypothetical protein
VERRRVIDLAEVRILGEGSSELGIEVAGLGVVEAGLGVEDVAGESESISGAGQLIWESEIAPGVEVVARDRLAVVVRQVDDASQAVEREVAAALVGPCQGDEAIGAVVVLRLLVAGGVVLGE